MTVSKPKAVLFDMDGVLYDSMPGHARAWMEMCRRYGITATPEEIYASEGRTGAGTIDCFMMRQYGRHATEAEIKEMYGVKSAAFAAAGTPSLMPGGREAVRAAVRGGALTVLVTGSGQHSLLERLNRDYDGAFPPQRRVTALDVVKGKPDPEPYLRGLMKAGVTAAEAVAVDNAPLGVTSAHAAGVFTIGVITGPLPEGSLLEAGADVELYSMARVAAWLEKSFAE